MCIFKAITGMPCPGCGMTRAFLHFFSGDLKGAFHFHPLFWLVPLIAVLLLVSRKGRWTSIKHNHVLWSGLLFLFLGVYVWRMMAGFPKHAPLDFNEAAILPQLWHLFFF